MRIAIDCTAAVHQQAGIGRYTRGLLGGLARLRAGHDYVLFTAGGQGQGMHWLPEANGSSTADRFLLRRVPLPARLLAILWHRLRLPLPMEVFTGSVDVFHSPDYVLPPLRHGRKVVTIHDLSFLRYPEGAEPSLRRYLSLVVPRSARRADLVLADSRNTKQDIVELLGVAPEKVEVLYPGVDQAFAPVADEARIRRVEERYGLSLPFILTVGTLEPRKNAAELLKAYAAIRGRGEVPHKLLIVGNKGWLYEGIFRTARDLSLEEDVRFLGFVPDEDLAVLYNLAEVFVFPSVYEGFGLPPLEAMACGTPVVTSDSSSLPEVVGEAGLMVSGTDSEALARALSQVLRDPALRKSLSARGLQRARTFSWQTTASRLLTIYDGLADTPSG